MPDLQDIERDLAQERDALRAQIQSLGTELRPGRIVESVAGHFTHGSAAETVGPMLQSRKTPLALTGLGLSWLAVNFLNRGPDRARITYDERDVPTAPGLRQTHPEGPDMADFDARMRAADRADTAGRFGTETYEGESDMTDSMTHEPTLRDRAYASVDTLRRKLDDGIESLPDSAKARIRAAREAAIDAQGQVEYHARRTAAAARQTAQDNPLLIGALVFAAGAALAAALPRTSTENRTIGAHRDRLFDEADRVFREEVAKAKSTAQEVVAQGQERVKEKIEDAADGVSHAAEQMKSDSAKSKSNRAAH